MTRTVAGKMEAKWGEHDVSALSRFELNGNELFEVIASAQCDGEKTEARFDARTSAESFVVASSLTSHTIAP